MPKSKIQQESEQRIADLTNDLQRTRADFENYRKRAELEKTMARESGRAAAVMKLLPVVDDIERAISHAPTDIVDNVWVQSVIGLTKKLDKSLEGLGVKRIESNPGTPFDPELHEAIQVDEDAEGDHEVIAEQLQAGYTMDGRPIRHAMVKVTRK